MNRSGDNRYGGDRYQDNRMSEPGGDGRNREHGSDDRGFFDRAGDEVRSWFGDDEAERRRERDERRWESEHGMTGRRDNRDAGDNRSAYMGTGGGWGNQSGDAWNNDRPGAGYRSDRYRTDRYSSNRMEDRSDEDWGDGHPSDRYGSGDRGQSMFGEASGGQAAGTWGGSGYGGSDGGRRFDRADTGSTGTHGAHPMSAPVGGGAYGAGYGISSSGGSGSSARYGTEHRHRGEEGGNMLGRSMGNATAGGLAGTGTGMAGRQYDPHYAEWRSRQVESLDRDYDEYRREHQSRFEEDFGQWRTKRTEQRRSMGQVTEQMEVVGSDGEHIGTVDKVRGDRIILTKNDENAGGVHHSIPCSWIDSVEDKVKVNKSKDEAMRAWRDEDRSRALFEREDSGSGGPHMLNRSFSGTY